MKRKNYFKQIVATLALAGVMFFGSAPSANAASLLDNLQDLLGDLLGAVVKPPSPPTTSSFIGTSSFRSDAGPTHKGLNKPAVASIADAD